MDTSKMLRISGLDVTLISSLVNESGQLKRAIAELSEMLERSLIYTQIVEVFKQYDLGEVTDVYEIFGGYVNRSFGVYTAKDGEQKCFFVRRYKRGITESEIELEHSLIDFSIAHGLEMAAGLIRAGNQKTYVKLSEFTDGKPVHRFYAIYDFLPGEDKYTWDNPNLNDEEYASAGRVLATLHNAARNFDPRGRKRVEPKIMELLPMLPVVFREYAEGDVNSKFHNYFSKSIEEIIAITEATRIPQSDLGQLLQNPIHSDFHPGNLKFKDNKVVGIFDFDWCKIDLRLFDICLAMVYTCCSWQDELDGTLLLDKCKIFLGSYQETLAELGGLPGLSKLERQYMPIMIAAANIYLINWTVSTYYKEENLNVYEYLAYMQHNVRLMKWIDGHKEELLDMAKGV